MIYEEYYILSELQFWSIEHDIPWDQLDTEQAAQQNELNAQLREACFIESYHPIGTRRLMELLIDDLDATSILSIELFEGFRHYYVLKRYLEIIKYSKAVTEKEVIKKRKNALTSKTPNTTEELVTFTFSEHFAAYYFSRIAQQSKEPVLKSIARNIARDEFRHTQAAYDILDLYLRTHPKEKMAVMEATYNFKHYGHLAVEEVPIFQRNDIQAITTFIKKVERLTGIRLIDYIKEKKLAL